MIKLNLKKASFAPSAPNDDGGGSLILSGTRGGVRISLNELGKPR